MPADCLGQPLNANVAITTQPQQAFVALSPAAAWTSPAGATHIATNLALDQDLFDRALRVSGEPTKKAAVTRALQEFIARHEQRQVAELFGKLDWDTAYDHKAERARKP